MENMLNFYQHLSEHIDPVAFKVGIFSINWYSLMYIAAFLTVYLLLRWRMKRGENTLLKNPKSQIPNPKKIQNLNSQKLKYSENKKLLADFMFYAILGVLVGGRLGYVLFYNLPYYLAYPLEIFLPIQAASFGLQVTGIYGMSYHGGLIGVILASLLFTRKYKIEFWQWSDFVIPAIPAGYFFGRIGNFLNGELYGRATEKFWGMYFLSDFSGLLRHPSQLYEAFFEGIVLFIVLWFLRNRLRIAGYGLCAYLIGYGIFRFGIEFFREPDLLQLGSFSSLVEASPQIGLIFNLPAGGLTLGQLLSLAMIVFGLITCFVRARKNKYNEANG